MKDLFKKFIVILIVPTIWIHVNAKITIGWGSSDGEQGFKSPTPDELVHAGQVVKAFYVDIDQNTQWEQPDSDNPWSRTEVNLREKLEKMDNFFNKYANEIAMAGITKEEILTGYIQSVNEEKTYSQLIAEKYDTSDMQGVASQPKVNNYEITKNFYYEKYPQLSENIQFIENVNERLNETKGKPQAFIDYYLNQDSQEATYALQLIDTTLNIDSNDNSINSETRLKLHRKLQTGMESEHVQFDDMNKILWSIYDVSDGGQYAGAYFEFLQSLARNLDPQTQLPIFREEEHSEPLVCVDLYQFQKNSEQARINAQERGITSEESDSYELKLLTNSYIYFKSIGMSLDTPCSDGVPYLDRLKDILKNEKNFTGEQYCSLVITAKSEEVQNNDGTNSKTELTAIEKQNRLAHLTNVAEGLGEFMLSMEVDTSTKCSNGKTIKENLTEKIDEISKLANELPLNRAAIGSNKVNIEVWDQTEGCQISFENLLEQDLPCDISAIIVRLSESLNKREQELNNSKDTSISNYNEYLADKYWHHYPDLKEEDCYFTMLSTYRQNKADYKIVIKVKDKMYQVKLKYMTLERIRSYINELKMLQLKKTQQPSQ